MTTLITLATWLITIPAAWGLWLVLSEDAPERVSQRELDAANEYAVYMDTRRRARMRATRGQDAYDWHIRFREAEHLRFIRRFRIMWDGNIS